jgi:hypothetical protein
VLSSRWGKRLACLGATALTALTLSALVLFGWSHLERTAFWYDESMQFWMSLGGDGFDKPLSDGGTLHDAILSNGRGNLDPGGFTLALRVWMAIGGTSGVWQRALPFLFFVVGMAGLAALAYGWRRNLLFAALGAFLPACFPLLLEYAGEVRAYSMEFAGVCLGVLSLDRLMMAPSVSRGLVAGTVFGVFLSSRYSYGLFTAAACLTLGFAAPGWRRGGHSRRAIRRSLAAFAAPLAGFGILIGTILVLPQYALRISYDGFRFLRYLDPLTAAGKAPVELVEVAARNLLFWPGFPLTLAALVGVLVLLPSARLAGTRVGRLAPQTANLAVLCLATLWLTIIVWPWHPWGLSSKYSNYLQALSAIVSLRAAAIALEYSDGLTLTQSTRRRMQGTAVLAALLVLALNLALYRRPAGAEIIPTLEVLESTQPPPGSVAVAVHWYPVLRYFYEFGPFRGTRLYPDSFRLPYHGGPRPLIVPATRFVISNSATRDPAPMWPGVNFARSERLARYLHRVEIRASSAP